MAKYDKSEKWFGEKNLEGFLHRSGMKAQGWPDNMIKDLRTSGMVLALKKIADAYKLMGV